MTQTRILTRWAAVVAVACMTAGVASAQSAFGRIALTVLGPDGEPLRDVEVRVTHEQIDFDKSRATNRKGVMTMVFTDTRPGYRFAIDHPGHEPVELLLQPKLGGTAAEEVTLRPAGSAPEASGAPSAEAPAEAPPASAELSAAQRAFNAAVTAIQAGDLATAKAQLAEALAEDPELAIVYSAQASVHLEEQDYAAALAAAERFRELEPESSRPYRLIYFAYQGLGEEAKAKEALEQLNRLGGGENAALIYNEGVAALRAGDSKGAEELFRQALVADPELLVALDGLAVLLLRRGAYSEALVLAERALALDPANTRALRARYDGYRLLGDEARAATAFEALAATDPAGVADDFYRQGVSAFEAGDATAAVAAFERAVAADPGQVKAYFHLGLSYVNLGQPDKAKANLSRFLELAPDDPDAGLAREMLSHVE